MFALGTARRKARLDAFPDRCDSLASTDTHRRQAITAARTPQFAHQFGRYNGTGRADGMPSEMPLPFGFTRSGSRFSSRATAHALCGKGVVGLDHVKIAMPKPARSSASRVAGTGPIPM